jgi:hypothetical protein
MSIVSSVIVSRIEQVDHRIRVVENHVDSFGARFVISYLAELVDDVVALLATHALQLASSSITNEIAQNIAAVTSLGSLATVTFVYSTPAQNVTALRSAYRNATQVEAIMIGDFLSSLTDVQLENAFSLSLAQVTTLRANRLTPAANAAAAIRAAVGA